MDTGSVVGLILIVVVVAGVAGAVFLRRRRLELVRARAKFIQQYAFPMELRNRLQRNTGLDLAQSGRVLEGLRQYFLACLSAQRSPIAKEVGMPSKAVDAAWHEFIVLTKEYAAFCLKAFGKYLHHTPGAMMSTPTPAALANTLHQLKQPAIGPAQWAMLGTVPLLFAIDRELGFKDGHMYDEGAIQQLEATRQMQLAAASSSGGSSDSGTGSGSSGSSSDSGSSWFSWGGSGDSSGDSSGGGSDGGGGGSCGGGGGGCGGS